MVKWTYQIYLASSLAQLITNDRFNRRSANRAGNFANWNDRRAMNRCWKSATKEESQPGLGAFSRFSVSSG